MNEDLTKLAIAASHAARQIARLNSNQKNEILLEMADNLIKQQDLILEANAIDIIELKETEEKNSSEAMIDRLLLTPQRIKSMANALREIVQLPDPVGKMTEIRIR